MTLSHSFPFEKNAVSRFRYEQAATSVLRNCWSCNLSRWREVLLVTLEILAFKMPEVESLFSCFFGFGNCIWVLKNLSSKKYFKLFCQLRSSQLYFIPGRDSLGSAVKMVQHIFHSREVGVTLLMTSSPSI